MPEYLITVLTGIGPSVIILVMGKYIFRGIVDDIKDLKNNDKDLIEAIKDCQLGAENRYVKKEVYAIEHPHTHSK